VSLLEAREGRVKEATPAHAKVHWLANEEENRLLKEGEWCDKRKSREYRLLRKKQKRK